MCEEQRKQFFKQSYGAHLPGWVHVINWLFSAINLLLQTLLFYSSIRIFVYYKIVEALMNKTVKAFDLMHVCVSRNLICISIENIKILLKLLLKYFN